MATDTKKDAPASKPVKGSAAKAPAEGAAKKADAKPAAPKAAKAPAAGPKLKPKLSEEQKDALATRAEKKARTPRFRRHEWWRYKRLGGKHASWRLPRGIHSKTRRHFGYRPPVPSIGYGGPAETRGLHPSGFQEVLVHNVDDLAKLEKATQAARIGGTVGGRKQEQITKEAAKLGVRVLNPYREA